MRRRITATTAAIATVVIAGGASVVVSERAGSSGADPAAAAAPEAGRSTAEVVRRDLVDREELDGTLGYGDTSDLAVARPGTITALPPVGSVVGRNGVIAEIAGSPVRLLIGARPLWRDLGPGASDGSDIRQLEENLVELGHASAKTLTVDDAWTDATTIAVKRWQRSNGAAETGTVAMGDVTFAPSEVRIVGHRSPVGGQAGGAVLQVTSTAKIVSVDLEATRRDLMPVGTTVSIELPDGAATSGTVVAVDSVVSQPAADAQGGGDPTVGVTITLDDPSKVAFDESPVDVSITSTLATGVLTVPVDALLALAEGGYAVELVDGATTRLVGVELGAFADGYVEISGDVAEGDDVVVPR